MDGNKARGVQFVADRIADIAGGRPAEAAAVAARR